jgi:hypothetical protein
MFILSLGENRKGREHNGGGRVKMYMASLCHIWLAYEKLIEIFSCQFAKRKKSFPFSSLHL